MVRIAVRTISLNVYKVQNDSMLRFIRDKLVASSLDLFFNLLQCLLFVELLRRISATWFGLLASIYWSWTLVCAQILSKFKTKININRLL